MLILLERVSEAQRLATRELREMQEDEKNCKKNKKRKGNTDAEILDEDDANLNTIEKSSEPSEKINKKRKVKR